MPVIETYGLSRNFGSLVAVKNLTLTVGQGEILGFLDPNGAGKTTTIRMLSGMIAPTRGYAVVGRHSETSRAYSLLTTIILGNVRTNV